MATSSLHVRVTALLSLLPWTFLPAGCGATRFMRDGGQVSTMTVRPVDWNPQKIDVGKVSDVAESAGSVVVFGDEGASVLSSGALVAVDRSATRWRTATSIAAADGNGRWIVAVDGDGTIRRLRNGTTLEPIGDRYGLGDDPLVGLADWGNGFVGFLGERGFIAISDGKSIVRHDVPFVAIAGGGGKGAAIGGEAVRLFDPIAGSDRSFTIDGARFVAVDAHGRLYVATEREVYEEDARGELSLRYETTDAAVHGLVVSGERVWFADGNDLGVLEPPTESNAGGASITHDFKLGIDAKLEPASSGEVWAIANGALTRWARADVPSATPGVDAIRARTWSTNVQPIFARRCSGCHTPGGASGIDLSTLDRWNEKRALIRKRVVDTRTMPPQGNPIDDAERAAIEEWTR